MYIYMYIIFFFFKQKTAYEMRISDWSSDVCSSDLSRQQPAVAAKPITRNHPHKSRQRRTRNFNNSILKQSVCWRGTKRRKRPPHQIGRASCRERVCQYV